MKKEGMAILTTFLIITLPFITYIRIKDIYEENKKLKNELREMHRACLQMTYSLYHEIKQTNHLSDSINKYVKSPEASYAYALITKYLSERHNIDEWLIYRVVSIESSWRSWAVSKAGAVGLMQVMPIYWPEHRKKLRDPVWNIMIGIEVIKLFSSTGDVFFKYSGGAYTDKEVFGWCSITRLCSNPWSNKSSQSFD